MAPDHDLTALEVIGVAIRAEIEAASLHIPERRVT